MDKDSTVATLCEPNCPSCAKPLERVPQSDPSGMLNRDQWQGNLVGDWFCRDCTGDRGRSGFRYYWDSEVVRVRRYQAKPVVVEAIQYSRESCRVVCAFAGIPHNPVGYDDECAKVPFLEIPTTEGVMKARVTDWIIKDPRGKFYPCADEVFKVKYALE